MFSNTPAAPAARAHDDASVEPPPRLGRVGQHRFPRVDMVAKLSTGDKPLSTARSASRGRSPTAECAGQDRRRPVLVPRLNSRGPKGPIAKPRAPSPESKRVVKQGCAQQLADCPEVGPAFADSCARSASPAMGMGAAASEEVLARHLRDLRSAFVSDLHPRLEALEKRLSSMMETRLDNVSNRWLEHWVECKDFMEAISTRQEDAEEQQRIALLDERVGDGSAVAGAVLVESASEGSGNATSQHIAIPKLDLKPLISGHGAGSSPGRVSLELPLGSTKSSPSPKQSIERPSLLVEETQKLNARTQASRQVWECPENMAEIFDDSSQEEGPVVEEEEEDDMSCWQRWKASFKAWVHFLFGEEHPDSRFYKTSVSPWFQGVGFVMTALNCVAVAIDVEWTVVEAFKSVAEGSPPRSHVWAEQFLIVQRVFVVWLLLEILVNFVSMRALFILGHDRYWNLFDLFVLIISAVSVLDVITQLNSSYLRVIRMVKALRSLRAIRFVRYSESLQRMMASSFHVCVSLLWTASAMLLLFYMFGIAIMDGLAATLEDHHRLESLGTDWRHSEYVDASGLAAATCDGSTGMLLQVLQTHYGGFGRTIVTLFRAISGADWGAFAAPLHATGWFWGVLWMLFVFIAVFGIASLLTAVIVNIMRKPLPNDPGMKIEADLKEEQTLHQIIVAEMLRHDLDPREAVPMQRFNRFFRSKRVSRRVHDFGVSFERLGSDVFDLVDHEGIGAVSARDIAKRLLFLRGAGGAPDIVRLRRDIRQIRSQIYAVGVAAEETRSVVGQVGKAGQASAYTSFL